MNYAEVDAEIVRLIKSGHNTAGGLVDQKFLRELAKDSSAFSPIWRIIERRLQTLRKQGVIRFDSAARIWEIPLDEGA